MSEPDLLRVLLIEDSENDAILLLRELRRGAYEPHCRRVDTPEAMETALRDADEQGEPWDIIISDYYMPRFTGPDALAILRKLGYDTPFIVVSGKVGEDLAVEIMKSGAHDYITKENMVRLNPAIERELREAGVRRERIQTQEALDRSEERFRRLVEQAADAMFVHDLEGRFVDVNRRACESLGYTREELLEMSVPDVEADYEPGALEKLWRQVSSGTQRTLEGLHRRKDGTIFPVEVRLGMFESEGSPLMLATVRDVTGRKKAEDELRESEERFRATFEQAAVGILQVGLEGGWVRVNDRFCEIVGYTREELGGISVFDLISAEDFEADYERGDRMLAGELRDYTEEKCIVGKDGRRVWINLTVSLVHDASDEPRYFIAIVEDISQRRQAEEGLRLRDRAIAASSNGIIISDPNQPDDPIIYVNAGFERITGYTSQEVMGLNCRFLQGEDREQPDLDELRAAIREGCECTVILRNYKKDGTLFWNELRVSPVRDERGRLVHFIGVQNDVTERYRAEETVRESEKRFRALVQNASDIIIVLDSDGAIRYESPALERILGYKPEERIGKSISDLVQPDDLEHVARVFEAYINDPDTHQTVEYRVQARDGAWRHFEGIGNNLIDDPSVRGIVVNARDVTDRKRAEQEIKDSEEKYRTLFETMTQGVVYQDSEGRITSANPAAERILGLSLKQMQGRAFQDPRGRTIREDGSEFSGWEHPISIASNTGEKVENEVMRVYVPERDGYRWIRVDAVPQFRPGEDHPYQSYAIFEDISGRKKAEDDLQWSEGSLAEAQRIAHLGNWYFDVARNRTYWSAELYRIFGLESQEFIPAYKTFLNYVHPEDKKLVRDTVRAAWDGIDCSSVEYRVVRAGGEVRTVITRYECARDASGRPERLIGTVQDVTEREQAERALREGEERYRAVVEQATEGILLVDVDSKRLLEANAAYQELLGYSSEEILELTLYDLVPYPRYDMDCYVQRVLEQSSYVSGERRHRRKDGSLVDVEVRANVISYGGREVICMLIRDITERKQNEAKLRRQATLINLSHDAIVVRDTDGAISYWNRGAEEVYGWSKEEAVGSLMHELLKTEFPFSREDVEATLQFGGRWEGELRHMRSDGEIIEVESRQVVVGEAESRIVLEINRDITERKRNEAELTRLASFPRLNPAPIIETDAAGNTTYLNPAADAWFQEFVDHGSAHPMLEDLERVEVEIRRSGGRPLNREVRVGENFYLQTVSRLPESGLLRIYATDVTERRRAEDGLRFLARASEVLSSSLDYPATLASVADLAVPDLADWCVIDIFENGSLNRLAVVHENPEKILLARQLRERYPPDPESQYGVPRVLREGGSVLVPEVTESLLQEAAKDEEHLEILNGLGLKSYMAVPLVVRGRTIGMITLASDELGFVYGEADLELAEDLARRAAVAVDNARLYYDAQKELSEREEAEKALREVREAERNRIARDLHDDVLQDIVYALQEASILEALSENGETSETVGEISDALRRSVEGLRESIFDLRVEATLKQSFIVSLKSLVELNRRMSRKRYALDLDVEEGFPEQVPYATGREIIRVLQEALTNVRRHARPRRVRVRLGADPHEIRAEVEDDGDGFDAGTFTGGVGQHSMRQRVAQLGGQLRVESEPGAGTRVSFRVPYYPSIDG